MATLVEFRNQYPQYDDMSDEVLANALHRKFYADMPEEEFRVKIGLASGTGSEAAPRGDGLALNATAGLNNAIYTTLGAPVDLARGAINLGARGINAVAGTDISSIPSNSFGGSESISSMFGAVGVPEPKDIAAATTGERIARGVGEGVGYAVAPEAAFAGLARAGALSPRAAEMGGRLFGTGSNVSEVAGNAIIGGASGFGASAAMEAAPEQWKPVAGLAGGMGGGFAGALAATAPQFARAGGRAVGEFAAPLTKSGRESLAAAQIRDNATDPQAVRMALEVLPADLVSGSSPTTFQLTGDMGLGGLERGAQTRRPEIFNQRRADQNNARVSALGGVQAEGAPEKVAQSARAVIQAVEQRAEQAFEAATSRARQSTEAIGRGASPEVVGDDMRTSLEEARKVAKETERKLWSAVDPDGSLALPAANARKQVADILADLPKTAKPPTGEEAAIYQVSGQLGDVAPFSEITALHSRVKTELRAERLANGESAAYRRLSQLNSALRAEIEAAVSGKMQTEADAVAKGEMQAEDTLAFRMKNEVDGWLNAKQVRTGSTDDGARGFAPSGSRSSSISGETGAGRQARGGFASPAGNQGLSPTTLEPNFDAGAAERLSAAQLATRSRLDAFDNKTLAPIRRRPSTVSPYDMASASVPQRIFSSRAGSAEAIGKFRAAVGDRDAMRQIEDYAVDRLRKAALRDDGTLDPVKLESWRRAHSDALKALPVLNRRLADAATAGRTMAEVATQQKAVVDQARGSRLGQMMNLSDPGDVTRAVGSIFQLQDRNNQMGRLASVVARDPEAKQGLRKAVVDHVMTRFVGNSEAATTGQATIRADQFQTFMKENKPALRLAGFSDDEVKLMTSIASDIQRAKRSLTAVKLPGGSNTAQDWQKVREGDAPTTILGRILMATAATGGIATGGIGGGIVGVLGAKTAGVLREFGIESVNDLVADAMLNPGRARILLSKYQPHTAKSAGEVLASVYRRSVVPSVAIGVGNTDKRDQRKLPQVSVRAR